MTDREATAGDADPGDPLATLGRRLDALADEPVDHHPDVLDAVHQAVVAELDTLSGLGAGRNGPAAGRDDPRG